MQRFCDATRQFLKQPTPHGRKTLAALCVSLSPKEAQLLLSDVFRAYDGNKNVHWLSTPNALHTLFDVGDLADRLAEAATPSVKQRRALRQKAVDEAKSARLVRHDHEAHIERLDSVRRVRSKDDARNAAMFQAMRATEFCGARGKVQIVLASDDDFLARQPPLWWTDLSVEDADLPVQYALVHRLDTLQAHSGRGATPPSVRSTLDDIRRRTSSQIVPECDSNNNRDSCDEQKQSPPRRVYEWPMRWLRRALSWIFPWTSWR